MCERWLKNKIKKIALLALRIYAFIIGYRFKKYIPSFSSKNQNLSLPEYLYYLKIDEIKEKSRGSLTTSGIFFAFCMAVIVALIGTQDIRQRLGNSLNDNLFLKLVFTLLNIAISYLVIFQEKFISAASTEKNQDKKDKKRCRRYIALIIFCVFSILLFIVVPMKSPPELIDQDIFQDALSLSGFFLIILSAFFLLFSLEFYDSASGWRRKCMKTAMHFHLASIASHSSLIGFCLALVGISQLLCIIHFWLGSIATCITLFILVTMTEIERSLWDHS